MFPVILKQLRIERQLTRHELAAYLNKTPQAYRYYENGKREPNYDTLVKLADFFNVSVDFLLGRKYRHLKDKDVSFLNVKGLRDEDLSKIVADNVGKWIK